MATEEVGIRLSLSQRREVAVGLQATERELEAVGDKADSVTSRGRRAAATLARLGGRALRMGIVGLGRGVAGVSATVGRGLWTATRLGARGLGLLSLAAGYAGVKAIGLAGDARETGSAFRTVFGKDAPRLNKELTALGDRFGLYLPDLQDATRQFGVFGQAAGVARKELPGFSRDLVKAGLDLSSFYNVDQAEAFLAVQSGLAGEAEPLRRFGIFLSQAALEARAAQMGLTGELTEQQKVMVRQKLILEGLGKAQGDLARTAKGYANQQRAAGGITKTFLQTLGGPLTTAATGFWRGFNKVGRAAVRELETHLPLLERHARRLSRRFEEWGGMLAQKVPGSARRAGGAIDWLGAQVDKLPGYLDRAKAWWERTFSGQAGEDARSLGDNLSELKDGLQEMGGQLPGVADAMSVLSTVTGFLADHTDELAAAMPYLIALYVAGKVAQLGANVAALLSVPVRIAEVVAIRAQTNAMKQQVAVRGVLTGATVTNTGAETASTAGKLRNVAATVAQRAAAIASAAATKVAAAAQWIWNAALTANPIGIVVVAVALLVGALVLLWHKSATVRSALIQLGIWGVKAFRFLVAAAIAAFEGILWAAEKGLGWIPGLGGKIKGARAAFSAFGDAAIAKLDALAGRLETAKDKADALAKDRSATITINEVHVRSTITKNQNQLGPTYARGTNYHPGGLAIVGEEGPELVNLPRGSKVIPNERLSVPDLDLGADLELGHADPTPIEVPVYVDGREVARATINGLETEEARR